MSASSVMFIRLRLLCSSFLSMALQFPRICLELLIFTFVCLFLATWLARPQFLNQGLNPWPLQCKRRVLTTGLPGKSPLIFLLLMDIWIASSLGYNEQCCLRKHVFWCTNLWFLLSWNLGVELPCCRVGMCLALEDKTEQVFRAVVPVIPLLTSSEHSSCSSLYQNMIRSVKFQPVVWYANKAFTTDPQSPTLKHFPMTSVNSPPRADFNLLT